MKYGVLFRPPPPPPPPKLRRCRQYCNLCALIFPRKLRRKLQVATMSILNQFVDFKLLPMQATKYTVNLRQITDIQKPLTININIEGTIAGNNPITKKGASKVRGQARCFRQVINKTKKFFTPLQAKAESCFQQHYSIGYIQILILTTRISNRPTMRTYCLPCTRSLSNVLISLLK